MTDRGNLIHFQALVEGTPDGPAVKKLVLEPSEGGSLKSHDLRSVSLRDILTEAARAAAVGSAEKTTKTGTQIIYTPLGDGNSQVAGTLSQLKKGRRRLTKEFLSEVADIYNTADAAGLNPTKAVVEAYNQPKDTVRHWIHRARHDEHLIPPRGKGQPPGRIE